MNSTYVPFVTAAAFFGGLFYFNRNQVVEQETTTIRIEVQEVKVMLEDCNKKLIDISPVTETFAAAVGARMLEGIAKKAGQSEKAKQYRAMREELFFNGPLRREAEDIQTQGMIGDITAKINKLIYAVEHDEGEVNEEKYPEMVSEVCWVVEQLRYTASFENYKKIQEQLIQIVEDKKMTSVAATPWLKHIDIPKLMRIDYNHHQAPVPAVSKSNVSETTSMVTDTNHY